MNRWTCPKIYKVGGEWNYWTQWAYDISGCDLDFIAMLEAENDQWTVDRIGITGDIGLCQVSPVHHPWITSHPMFYNPYWQSERCRQLWELNETFYGAANIPNTIKRFYTHE